MTKKHRRRQITKDIFTTDITQLNHEGRGIAHIDGKATFLFGGLSGEKVQFQYSKMHRQYDEGSVVEVLEKSPDRVIPQCAHFGVCGGCSLQHLSSDAQRAHKQHVLLEHFQHQADVQPQEILPPLYGNPWEYRRKARLSIRYVFKKESVLVGFRERGSSYVALINQCEILHPSIGKKIKAFSELLMRCEMKAQFAQLEIAVGDNTTAVVLRHMVELPKSDIEKLMSFSRENHLQLYFQPKGPESVHAVYPENPDELYYDIPAEKIRMHFQPMHFTQINQEINLKMMVRAIELLELKSSDRVLDLFCGIGNFSLPIAKHCAHVVGVEGADSSIIQARKNAVANNISNTEFYTQDLCADLSTAQWNNTTYDKILLDPPRVGAKELMPYIAAWKPTRIVYVSCNPITLARDAKELLSLGYILEKAGVMDMFPHTDHIEAIALFVKNS